MALKYLYINARNQDGAELFRAAITSPLSLPSILADEAILAKKVKVNGEIITCKFLRQNSFMISPEQPRTYPYPESSMLGHVLPPKGANYCPSMAVLTLPRRFPGASGVMQGTANHPEASNRRNIAFEKKQVEENLSALASRVRQFRRATQDAIKNGQKWAQNNYPNRNIALTYVDISRESRYTAEDIGPDCMHISELGQLRLARNSENALKAQNVKPTWTPKHRDQR